MEAFIAQRKLYKCFKNSLAWLGSCFGWFLVGALAKWGSHLFIGTNGTLWNLGGFFTDQEYSRTPYTNLCTTLCTRIYKKSLEFSRKPETPLMPSTTV